MSRFLFQVSYTPSASRRDPSLRFVARDDDPGRNVTFSLPSRACDCNLRRISLHRPFCSYFPPKLLSHRPHIAFCEADVLLFSVAPSYLVGIG